jgi:hypothetical protein
LSTFGQVSDVLGLVLKVNGDYALGLLRLGSGDLGTFLIELGGHFGVDSLPGRGQLLLLFANGGLTGGDLGLFLGELGLVPSARVVDERRRQGLGELDLGLAGGAGEGWFGH